MNGLEANVIRSFKRAKTDIIKLQAQMIELSKQQSDILEMMNNKQAKQVVKTVTKNSSHEFLASKTGKKFHIPECPFAKNIKPMSKVHFKSKTKALNVGYKACDCVKKV